MDSLGTLQDLPTDYVEALSEQHLVPLWPSLRALLPPHVLATAGACRKKSRMAGS